MKERLMVQKLIDEYLNDKENLRVAILAGIRKIGKTTILKQLQKRYKNSVYIDCRENFKSQQLVYNYIQDKSIELILIDEVTYIDDYETFAETIYNATDTKIIITGSSPIHLMRLARSKLGGGRSKLFKLSPITFIEYLYFTDKICSYKDINNIDNAWFINYLKGENLTKNLRLTFDDEYLIDTSYEIDKSNESSLFSISFVDISYEDLKNIKDIFAYKLSDMISNNKIHNINIATREYRHIQGKRLDIEDFDTFDISKLLLIDQYKNFKKISYKEKIRILNFLLESGMALAVLRRTSETESPKLREIMTSLKNAANQQEVASLLRDISIQLTTPIYYIALARDIFKKFGYDLDILDKGMITGSLLEVYIAGALSYKTNENIFGCQKLDYEGEVDIYDHNHNLIMELTVSNKKNNIINVTKYFKEIFMLRVCSSYDIETSDQGFHKIPYGKLICMIDNDSLFELALNCGDE